MKKILIVLLIAIALVGCGKKDELALGVYKERTYVNENFKLDFDIPEDFSYLNHEELRSVNENIVANSPNPENTTCQHSGMDLLLQLEIYYCLD